jgi:chemotaxis protein MotB
LSKIKVIVLFFLLAGCVSQKRYDDLWGQKAQLEVERANCEDQLASAKGQIEQLKSRLESLEDDRQELKSQLDNTGKQLVSINDQYSDLLANSDELNEEFLRSQQRIRDLEKILEEKEQAVNELKTKISRALLDFEEEELTVEIKNGKVYVSLAEQLLFKSGSIKVDKKGVEALEQMANVLKLNPDINIEVEGHTDNVPVSKTGQYMKDNWDLSVMRATSIVGIMVKSGIEPTRITASGRGEFDPKSLNEDPESRKKNRRTEIILTPDLNELFQILDET